MDTLTDLVNEMNRLIDAANRNQMRMRAFGGLAVLAHCRNNPKLFQREAPDLDFLVQKTDRQKLEPFFRKMGYSPDRQFNLLNGARRQIYHHDQFQNLHVDILIGDFEMCHKLPLDNRLDVDAVTIPLAELLLTKTQVVQLNRKDALDIICLLLNNEIGDERKGMIGLERIVSLCAQDWGLYKTTSLNLDRVQEILENGALRITTEERRLVMERVQTMRRAFDEMPKSLAWQMRDKVGTRIRWYLEVEEVDQ